MSKLHIWLLVITTYICTAAATILFMFRSGSTSELPIVIHSLLAFVLFIPVGTFLDRRTREDRWKAYQERLRPVRELVRSRTVMDGKEREYQHRLIHQLRETLHVVSKPEAPLPSGTRVDAYMEFGNEDWYITIKRRIDNQKRLMLQGEIEDIILHAPRRDRDLWVVVIVGVGEELDPSELAHMRELYNYAAYRSVCTSRAHPYRSPQGGPRVNVAVMMTSVPS